MSAVAIAEFERTTTACPAQWECTTADGRYCYIRYRGGRLRVELAPSEGAWFHESESIFVAKIGDEYDGCMTTAEMQAHLAGVLDFSAAREIELDEGRPVE